jgi:hypothetical protein
VFEDHAQSGESLQRGLEHFVDETMFTLEYVHLGPGHFAVHQKGHAERAHARQHLVHAPYVGDAGIRVGGGAGGIELAGLHPRGFASHVDFRRIGSICQIKRHQRRKPVACGQGLQDAFTIGKRLRGGGHRGLQIGHDNGAREPRRGKWHHCGHGGAITQVQMPVVGAADLDLHS